MTAGTIDSGNAEPATKGDLDTAIARVETRIASLETKMESLASRLLLDAAERIRRDAGSSDGPEAT